MRPDRPAEDHGALRVLHALPGRIRVRVASLPAGDAAVVEARLRAVAGVQQVRANPKTRTVLVAFDPGRVDAASVVAAIAGAATADAGDGPSGAAPTATAPPPAARLVAAGQVVVFGLDVALLLLGGGARRPPRPLAGAPPWLPMALAVARLLLERGLRAAPAPAPSPA